MKTVPWTRRVATRDAAFSLLELLVAMGLLSVIVLALFSMFDQTQKALHNAVGQVDVMESGRSAMDLLVRDIEKARAVNAPGVTNLSVYRLDRNGSYFIPGSLDAFHRDSNLHELFYLTPVRGGQWTAEGWFLAQESDPSQTPSSDLLASLYRFESTNVVASRGPAVTNFFTRQWLEFVQRKPPAAQFSRLLDGVVFFRVFPFGPTGQTLDHTVYPTNLPAGVVITNLNASVSYTAFTNQGLPSSLDIELGMLPPRLLGQFRALPAGAGANSGLIRAKFLVNHAADILVFRQRISLRTANP